jgi:hypothetical protein
MGDARVSRAAADTHHPLAEYGGVDQCVAPHHVPNARAPAHHFREALVRDERQLTRRHGHQAMVHHLEVKALQIWDVARDVKREDLAFPVLR